MLERIFAARLSRLGIQRSAPEIRLELGVLFTVQVSLIPCHAVKRRSVVGLGNAEAMRQLTHRHLIPGLMAFGHDSELQYAAGGLNQQLRACMHLTHGRRSSEERCVGKVCQTV